MIKECIILSGGLGTRLRSEVGDLPKVLAPVNEKPFLNYIIEHLHKQHIEQIVLSTGFMHEKVEAYINNNHTGKNIKFAQEVSPLGTGGGIANALKFCSTDEVLIINGDSFFNIDYNFFYHHHNHHQSEFSIALKPMKNFERYGTVEFNSQRKITAFREKTKMDEGMINAGVYIVNRELFLSMNWPDVFSMEKDYMEKYFSEHSMHGFPYDEYFIDIGVPEDYTKAQHDFKELFL